MSLKKEIGRANILFSAGKIIATVIAFFFNIYLARKLQPHDFGLYSFALVVVGMASLFTDLGINGVLWKFGSEKKYQGDFSLLRRLIGVTLKYKVILSVIVSGLMIVFSGPIALFFNKPNTEWFIMLSGAIVFFTSISEYLFTYFAISKRFKQQSMFRVAEQALKAVFIVSFLLVGFRVSGTLAGMTLSYIFLVAAMGWTIWKTHPALFTTKPKNINLKMLRTFGMWSTAWLLVGTIYTMADQLLISKLLSVENMGFYRAAFSWVFALSYLVPLSSQVMLTYYSNSMSSKDDTAKMILNSIKYTAILSFPFSFFLSAFSGAFVLLTYGASYLPVAGILKVLSFIAIPMLITPFFQSYFISVNRQDVAVKTYSVLSVVLFALGYVLITAYGLIGIAYAVLSVKLLELISFLHIMHVKEKISIPFDIIWKPLLSSVIVYILLDGILSRIFTTLTIVNFAIFGIAAFVMYFSLMFLFGGITREEIVAVVSMFGKS